MCADNSGLYVGCATSTSSGGGSGGGGGDGVKLTKASIAMVGVTGCLVLICIVLLLAARLQKHRLRQKSKTDQKNAQAAHGGLKMGPAASAAASLEWEDEHLAHKASLGGGDDPFDMPNWLKAANALSQHTEETSRQPKRPVSSPHPIASIRSPGGRSMEWGDSVHIGSEFGGSPITPMGPLDTPVRDADTPTHAYPQSRYLDDMDKFSTRSDKMSARSETAEAVYRLMEERQALHKSNNSDPTVATVRGGVSSVVPPTLRRHSSNTESGRMRNGGGGDFSSSRQKRMSLNLDDGTYESALGLRHHSVEASTKFLDPQETDEPMSVVDAAVLHDDDVFEIVETNDDDHALSPPPRVIATIRPKPAHLTETLRSNAAHPTATLRPAAAERSVTGGGGDDNGNDAADVCDARSRMAAPKPTYMSASVGSLDSDREEGTSWAQARKPSYMTARTSTSESGYTDTGSVSDPLSRSGVRHATYLTTKQDSDFTSYTASTIAGLGALAGKSGGDRGAAPRTRASVRQVSYMDVAEDPTEPDDDPEAYRLKSRQGTAYSAAIVGVRPEMSRGSSINVDDDDDDDDDIYDVATLASANHRDDDDDDNDAGSRMRSRQGTDYDETTYALATPSATNEGDVESAPLRSDRTRRVAHKEDVAFNALPSKRASTSGVSAVGGPNMLGTVHDEGGVSIHDVYGSAAANLGSTHAAASSPMLDALERGNDADSHALSPAPMTSMRSGNLFDRINTMASADTLAHLETQIHDARREIEDDDDDDGVDNIDLSHWDR
jgi:hypothetical protein